jgi:hypothetical protein
MTDPTMKEPVTVRISTVIRNRLKQLAKDGTTMSYLINQAIEQFLDGKPVTDIDGRPAILVEEVEAVIPVLKAIGKPVHVDLFFELIETQQGR